MTSLAYLVSPKVSDLASLTGSITVANSPISNLQKPQPRIRTIFTSGSCFVEGDLGANFTLNTLFIGYINALASTDTFRFRASLVYPPTSSPLVDSTALTIWPTGSALFWYNQKHRTFEHGLTLYRYFRVDFSCSAAPSIGRLFVGLRAEPEHSVNVWVPDGEEPIASVVDLGGQEVRRPLGGSRRTIHMEWPALSKTEALGKIYELLLERGSARDFAAVLAPSQLEPTFPIAYSYLGYGKLKVIQNTLTHLFSASLDMIEAAPLKMT